MEKLRATVTAEVEARYGVSLGNVPVQYPPSQDLGDIALPIAFGLAKGLRRSPKEIASEIAAMTLDVPGVAGLRADGGFLNLKLDREWAIARLHEELEAPPAPADAAQGKVIIEHTNINPNKAAHIGHLRNAVLGDTLVRLYRYLRFPVEVQSVMDDTGVQVADVAFALDRRGELCPEALATRIHDLSVRFDHFCWDVYADIGQVYEREPAAKEGRARMLAALEHGHEPEATLAGTLATEIVKCHLATMLRIGVRYDVFPRERDILRHRFWARAFEKLKESGSVYLATEGKAAGCWLLRLPEDEKGHQDPDKILVRSDGTTTYVGKDIAYQMWKFGLLGADFGYEPLHRYEDGGIVWTTRPDAARGEAPRFGGASRVINVIDTRQSYLQRVVREGLRVQGYEKEAEQSIHFAYEIVALSHACARELGLSLSDEDRGKPFVEMSGRRGLGVKADDLLDRLNVAALARVREANPELPGDRLEVMASCVARAALRYSMCKPGRTKIIAFDFDEALAFEGDTGPYVLYAAVRARSIFGKLAADGLSRDWVTGLFSGAPLLAGLPAEEQEAIWSLCALALRLPQVAASALAALEPSGLARYAFQLAQGFSTFYNRYHIRREPDEAKKRARAACAYLVMQRLLGTLDLLGIDVPERM